MMATSSNRQPYRSRNGAVVGFKVVAVFALAAVSVVAIAPEALAGPTFKAPWTCGVSWHASTYTDQPGSHRDHHAVDFNDLADGSDAGAPVLASAAGTATKKSGNGYGTYVDIDHGNGWLTRYAHLASVTINNPIAVGEPIGTVGGSGSYQPHLHYEQRLSGQGRPIEFDGARILVGTSYTTSDPKVTSTNCGGDGGGHRLGNWDGVGGDDVMLRRGSKYYVDYGALDNTDRSFSWGRSTDEIYVGDFDNDGRDDLLLRRGSKFYVDLKSDGTTNRSYSWGRNTDTAYIGNWDGVGGDDVMLRRGSKYYVDYGALDNTDRSFSWGRSTDEIYVGDFDNDGRDDLLLRRGSKFYVDLKSDGTTNRSYSWGRSTDIVQAGN